MWWKTPISVPSTAKWLPESVRQKIRQAKTILVDLTLFRAEKKVLKKKRRIPVSQWVEKHRVLTMSSLPGPWRNDVTPYLTGIMDAAGYPFVRTVIMCKSPQIGGSEAAHNFIGYCIDRAPGPVLYVYPDELTGRENSRDRIMPMIDSSPRLREYKTGEQDDLGMLRINMIHMPIYIAWARSAARLANKPIRYVIFDETDKYPETAGPKEADPISLGEARVITYSHSFKIWKLSTPTTEANFIWTAFTREAEVIFDYWVKCPQCFRHQEMKFDNIKVPEKQHNPNKILKDKSAWYQCEHCGSRWCDADRDEAVRLGQWRERIETDTRGVGLELFTYMEIRRPAKIAFHLPSWISSFVSLSKIMADWFAAQGDKVKLKDFKNKHSAIPWVDWTQDRKTDAIMILCDTRPRGMVPSDGIVALTAGVDTQKNGFWYEIRAWRVLEEIVESESGIQTTESYQVREGFVQSFSALSQVLFQDVYRDASGRQYSVNLAVMDAMGEKTSEVYDYCRSMLNRVIPFQGHRRLTQPYRFSNIEYYPGTKKLIPGGVTLLHGDVTYYKNRLASKLNINPADPGAWHLNADTSMEWAKHMIAEYVDDHGYWECKPNAANHGWDCSVYNLIAMDVVGVEYMAKRESNQNKKPGITIKSSFLKR